MNLTMKMLYIDLQIHLKVIDLIKEAKYLRFYLHFLLSSNWRLIIYITHEKIINFFQVSEQVYFLKCI